MEKYRLYIDESGTHGYSFSTDITKKYLGLLGVIISETEYVHMAQPKIRRIKEMFSEDPDELPILHREDIIHKSGPFSKLNNDDFQAAFNSALLDLLQNTNYVLCCIVLDKGAHLERYEQAAAHPYHYCLDVLLERYTFFLEEKNGEGDVMIEARGGEEDIKLKQVYRDFYNLGTAFKGPKSIQTRMTSCEIKIKPKSMGIEGLEFADLLSLACKIDTLYEYGVITKLTDNFCKVVIDKVQGKYRKRPGSTTVLGFGKKLIK